jgi:putative PIN family toxin of toxin-antitoxin system
VPRAVLDTNILISGLITPRGTPAKVLLAWRAGHFNLVTSLPLLLELKEALARSHLKDRYHLSSQDIRDFIALLKDRALLITDPGVVSAQLRDPDDLAVLACALAGDAEYIVTGDHDLLDLHSFEGVQVVRPSLFLQLLHLSS